MRTLVMIGGPADGATLEVVDVPRRVLIKLDSHHEVVYRMASMQPTNAMARNELQYFPDEKTSGPGRRTDHIASVLDAMMNRIDAARATPPFDGLIKQNQGRSDQQ